MKVIQVISNIQAASDGVANCVRHLTKILTSKIKVEIHTLKALGTVPSDINIKLYDDKKFNGLLSPLTKLGISKQMRHGLVNDAESVDIVHAHSLWMMQTYYAYKAVKGRDVKLCIHIHGTLSPWALSRSRIKKKISSLLLGQRKALKRADLLIASCMDEYNDIRNYGLKNPVAIITNGIELPDLSALNINKRKTVVFLSRIHPKKGLDLLLKAWKNIEDKYPEWNLMIAGNNKSEYGDNLKRDCDQLQCKRVEFTGEITGTDKYRFLANASIFVLPTHSENFGIAVGEALTCGTPVITTTGAPWSGLIDNNCGLWIDLSVENLTSALENMMSRPMDELIRMGQNGRQWIERDFSWDEIANKTIKSYEWLLNPDKTEKPNWIYID